MTKISILFPVLWMGICSHGFLVTPELRSMMTMNAKASMMLGRREMSGNSNIETEDDDRVKVTVALTREEGKNEKIRQTLLDHEMWKGMMLNPGMKLEMKELPCIEHAEGPDLSKLEELISSGKIWTEYDYIIVTSPEACKVFHDCCRSQNSEGPSSSSKVQFATVGKATQKALMKEGEVISSWIKEKNNNVVFCPSQANGETLAKELPPMDGTTKVLYPASAKAANTIQEELEARTDATFELTRLNTYDTVSAKLNDLDTHIQELDVACFGSPSAVTAWLENVDAALGITDLEEDDKKSRKENGNVSAACIGTTTARACLESGRWHAYDIYYPKTNPGMSGWADSIITSIGDTFEKKFWS